MDRFTLPGSADFHRDRRGEMGARRPESTIDVAVRILSTPAGCDDSDDSPLTYSQNDHVWRPGKAHSAWELGAAERGRTSAQ
jgi:hypothetical protein